jgi:hypothetical protein
MASPQRDSVSQSAAARPENSSRCLLARVTSGQRTGAPIAPMRQLLHRRNQPGATLPIDNRGKERESQPAVAARLPSPPRAACLRGGAHLFGPEWRQMLSLGFCADDGATPTCARRRDATIQSFPSSDRASPRSCAHSRSRNVPDAVAQVNRSPPRAWQRGDRPPGPPPCVPLSWMWNGRSRSTA